MNENGLIRCKLRNFGSFLRGSQLLWSKFFRNGKQLKQIIYSRKRDIHFNDDRGVGVTKKIDKLLYKSIITWGTVKCVHFLINCGFYLSIRNKIIEKLSSCSQQQQKNQQQLKLIKWNEIYIYIIIQSPTVNICLFQFMIDTCHHFFFFFLSFLFFNNVIAVVGWWIMMN